MKYLEELKSLAASYNHKDIDLDASTSFTELGMDSYEIVDFLVQVEKEFGVVIDDDAMLQIQTLQDVLSTLDKCSQEEN
jgi:Phosphopantetheine attachment site.